MAEVHPKGDKMHLLLPETKDFSLHIEQSWEMEPLPHWERQSPVLHNKDSGVSSSKSKAYLFLVCGNREPACTDGKGGRGS